MHDVTTPYDLYIDLMDSAVYPYVNGIPGTKFIELYQNEAKASIFNIHISKNYEFLDLKDKTVRIGFKKPDDEIVWQPCTIVDAAKGKVQVVLEEQTLAVAGEIRAQVQVSDAENRSAESAVFYLYVHESVITKKAIQSTSAAPLLEDAVKAGELFKDYKVSDLAAIKPMAEAAKQAADGAFPKTGGTITGTTIMASGDFEFKNAANDVLFRNNQTGIFSFYDKAQDQVVWSYNPATKEFTVNSASNLVKKTGDTMTGNLVMSNALAEVNFKDDKSEVAIQKTSSGAIAMWDRVNQIIAWQYFPATKEFRVPGETNLLKKTGDTMTGNFNFDVSSGEKSLVWRGGTTNIGFISGSTQNWRLRDWANSKDVFSYDGKTFNVLADSNLVTKTKDGRSTLTLTENATQYGSTYTPIATRRGNTVTLRMVISRNGNDSGVITTLPVDMRPVDGITSTILASDGTSSDLVIRLNGEVEILTKNKTYRISLTYVVD